MRAASLKATHKGWFLFAPVYVDMTDPDVPGMWARWEWLEFLVTAAHEVQSAMMATIQLFDEDYEPAFMITLTGEMP